MKYFPLPKGSLTGLPANTKVCEIGERVFYVIPYSYEGKTRHDVLDGSSGLNIINVGRQFDALPTEKEILELCEKQGNKI